MVELEFNIIAKNRGIIEPQNMTTQELKILLLGIIVDVK